MVKRAKGVSAFLERANAEIVATARALSEAAVASWLTAVPDLPDLATIDRIDPHSLYVAETSTGERVTVLISDGQTATKLDMSREQVNAICAVRNGQPRLTTPDFCLLMERRRRLLALLKKEIRLEMRSLSKNEKEPYAELLHRCEKKDLELELRIEKAKDEIRTDGTPSRAPIPSSVQILVWNRDGGRCVQCGSNENLEFDHIIPVSKGGANTARNLQLLCENCNRSKSNRIG
jgi:5-methylcytosine-specific restriction endonuclease McrA